MADIEALEKHSCAACGAQAEWDPAKQLLRCPFCGTVAPYELDVSTGLIREIDLVRTLRELSDEKRGWRETKRSVKCQSCHAVSVFDPQRVGQRCDFCGSPELVDYEEIRAPIRPESLLPFQISESEVRDRIRKWFGEKWFAPGKLKSRALIDQVSGIYLPFWTFDARVVCPWTAESGHYYYTEERYRDSDGNVKTRRKKNVRWEPASGRIEHFFDDKPISGSKGVDPELLAGTGSFPTEHLVPYDTVYLSGFVVEHYQVVLIDAAREAREKMNQDLYQFCSREVPGDTYKNLQIYPEYSDQTFKHILVPVWLLNYDFGRKKYHVIANGFTGQIAGEYPKSFWKIFLLMVSLVILVAVLFYLVNN